MKRSPEKSLSSYIDQRSEEMKLHVRRDCFCTFLSHRLNGHTVPLLVSERKSTEESEREKCALSVRTKGGKQEQIVLERSARLNLDPGRGD